MPRALRAVGRHWGLLLLLAAGITLRTLAVYAYVPAFYFPDSLTYLQVADTSIPQVHRPWGYSFLLQVFDGWGVPFEDVVVVQHALGVLAALMVYALLQHRGVRRWVSCLATAPLLLDGYLVQIEHYVMAESLFVFLLIAALVLLLWHERTPWWAGTLAGLLLGYAVITRTVGTFVLAVVAVFLLVRLITRSFSWLAAVGAAVGVVAVVLPYVSWFHTTNDTYALTDYTGHFLYGRVSNFADCDEVDVPVRLRGLCPDEPPAERPVADFYVWSPDSPANSGRYDEDDLTEFSKTILRGQWQDFTTSTIGTTLHYFRPGHPIGHFDACLQYWQFPTAAHLTDPPRGSCTAQLTEVGFGLDPVAGEVRPGLADFLAGYQRWVYTPGPVLAVLALVGLSGLVPHRRRGPLRDNVDAIACVAVALTVIAVPSATAIFDYRYGLPVIPILPIAAALATRRWLARTPADADGSTDGPPAESHPSDPAAEPLLPTSQGASPA